MGITFAEFEKAVGGFGEPHLPISPIFGLSACVGQLSALALEAGGAEDPRPENEITARVRTNLAGLLIFAATLARLSNLTLSDIAVGVWAEADDGRGTIEGAPE